MSSHQGWARWRSVQQLFGFLRSKPKRSKKSRGRLYFEPLESRTLLTATGGNAASSIAYIPPVRQLVDLTDGYLTTAQSGSATQIATAYIAAHTTELGLQASDVANLLVTDNYQDVDSGVTHVYFAQMLKGLRIANTSINVNIGSAGQVINVGSSFVANAAERVLTASPLAQPVQAHEAILAAAQSLRIGDGAQSSLVAVPAVSGSLASPSFIASSISRDPIPTELIYAPTSEGVRLSWQMVIRTPDDQHWYDAAVDVEFGNLVYCVDWSISSPDEFASHRDSQSGDADGTSSSGAAVIAESTTAPAAGLSSLVDGASYNVLARPVEAFNDGTRSIVVDPANPTASPYGWHDTNGAAGAEFTDTRGNNVSAQEDTDANNSGGFRPDGGGSLTFDFAIDTTQPPSTYTSAAITNLFYWNNLLHDIHYAYGFNESSGNFQVNNYGRGGSGNDAVQADAQDGSGTNNANFATPPDGTAPRMQQYIFTITSPSRDSSLDNQIIVHEYGHGVSNRLTGGPANSNALSARQSGGMGEGWSDWWGLMFTQKTTDVKNAGYGVGTYVLGETNTGAGIRRYQYSYNMTTDPLTYGRYNTSSEVHDSGEIWCSALWDLNWLLIDKYGFNANIAAGYSGAGSAGNVLALKLVMDALKLQPANPSFINARDAILLADTQLTGGANKVEIWTAFARRGMGLSAYDGGSANALTVTEAFDLPNFSLIVTSSVPANGAVVATPPTTFTIDLSEAYVPASVDASDLRVNGVAADSVTLTDADTLTFAFIASPVVNQGLQTISMAEGTVLRQSDGGGLGAYSGTFRYDSLTLNVASTSPTAGATVATGISSLTVNFNEPIAAASVSTADLSISTGSVTGVTIVDSDTVTFSLSGIITEGNVTYTIDAGTITDVFGNVNAAYSSNFSIDVATSPFATPLEALEPRGSLVYSGALSGLINSAGDIDNFTISLDAGQTLTVIMSAVDAGLQPSVDLTGPGVGVSATALAPGANAVLQTISIASAGTYTISASSSGGTAGRYSVRALLNVAGEAERYLGSANNTLGAAQNIDSSFITLAGTSQRGAVLGVTDDDGGFSATAVAPAFVDISTTGIKSIAAIGDDSTDTLTSAQLAGFTFPFFGTVYDTLSFSTNGLISFTTADSSYSNTDLSTSPSQPVIAALWDDLNIDNSGSGTASRNVFWQVIGSGASQQLVIQWNNARQLSGLTYFSFQAVLSRDGSVQFNYGSNVVVSGATVGVKGAGTSNPERLLVSYNQAAGALVGPNLSTRLAATAATADLYAFSVSSGSSVTLALQSMEAGGSTDVLIELLDGAGTVVSTGVRSSSASLYSVASFVATTTGTYYARTSASGQVEYLLTVGRSVDFDAEPNNGGDAAQDLPATQRALGFLRGDGVAGGGGGTATLLNQFAGVANGETSPVQPPDTHAAVGPQHVVEVVNTAIAIYDKNSGTRLLLQELNTFFAPLSPTVSFDPLVAYDELAGRWIVLALDADSGFSFANVLYAVSNTSNPLDGFTEMHRINTTVGSVFTDYPKVGWNANAHVFSFNMFPSSGAPYTKVLTIDKSTVLDANAGTFASYQVDRNTSHFTMAVATMHESVAGDPMWFVEEAVYGGGNQLRVTKMTNYLSASPVFTDTLVTVATYSDPPNAVQPGGTFNTNDPRILNAEYRDGRLVAAHAVGVGGESTVRWYEFNVSTGTPTLVQQGDVDPGPGIHTYFPAIAIANSGALGITYMQSSATEYVSMYATGQVAGSPAGVTLSPVLVKAGTATYGGSRGGDYAGITVDPVNDTFYAANEVILNSTAWATWIGQFSVVPTADEDWYQIQVNIGDNLSLRTYTPADGSGEFTNGLNPALTLFRPDGTIAGGDDNGAGDGRNAFLTHVATQAGAYKVRLAAAPGTQGEYVFVALGATGVSAGPTVIDTDPDVGTVLASLPTTITVHFSEAIDLRTLSASDLTINGLPANGFTVVDGDTIQFQVSPTDVGDGVYGFTLAAGAVADLQGRPLAAFSGNFAVDRVGPRIVSTLWNGSPLTQVGGTNIVAPGTLSLQLNLNEDLHLHRSPRRIYSPSIDDVRLVETLSGATVSAASVSYDAALDRFTINFAALNEGSYQLTLISGDGAFEDLVGNDLDGEPLGAGFDGAPTGNGTPGGNYVVNFAVDRGTAAFPVPLTRTQPLGSLVYSGSVSGNLYAASDSDSFTVSLDAGQTLSVLTSASFAKQVVVTTPSGTQFSHSSTATDDNLLRNVPVSVAGVYTIIVSNAAALGAGSGPFTVSLTLNSDVEIEGHVSGIANDSRATAQDISASGVQLAANATRYAVNGVLPNTIQQIVSEGFESGSLGAMWSTYSSTNEGRIQVSSSLGVAAGTYALWMDNGADSGNYVLNEAIMSVNLSGLSSVSLGFAFADHLDETDSLPASFTGHFNGDGVAISADGNQWFRVWTPTTSSTTFVATTLDLSAAAASAGIVLGAGFMIKFQQYDNFAFGTDGRGFDSIVVTAAGTPAEDWYSVPLASGEVLNAVLSSTSPGNTTFEVYDPAGALVITATPGASNVDSAVSNYIASSSGLFTLRVMGVSSTYQVVVTRGAAFDLEANDTLDTAQPLQVSSAVLGGLGNSGAAKIFAFDASRANIVAFNPLSGAELYRFPAPELSSNGPDALAYDGSHVFYLNGFGTRTLWELDATTGAVIDSDSISSGSLSYDALAVLQGKVYVLDYGNSDIHEFDPVTDVITRTLDINGLNPGVSIVGGLAGLANPNRLVASNANSATVMLIDPATGLVSSSFTTPSSIYGVAIADGQIYLGSGSAMVNAYNSNGVFQRSVTLSGAVTWGLGGDDPASDLGDVYSVSLTAGTTYNISTSTPGDGAGEFVNILDPGLDLYNSSGDLLASNDNGAADGRNASILFTPSATGSYKVRVNATAGTEGEYLLRVVAAGSQNPLITLTMTGSPLNENGGLATITATLSDVSVQDVTVNLAFSGTAASGTDYSRSGTTITIPAGSSFGSILLSALDDTTFEGPESIVIDVTSVTGGTENGTQQVTLSITDDDAPATFVVSTLTPTTTGFTALFNRTFVASALNLYTTQALAAASDVTLTGSVSGAVRGSIVLNAAGDGFTFVATAGLLGGNQTYTVTLRSGADAFQDALGGLLDGNADGASGDNYTSTFNVAAPSGDRRTLSVPNFARGYGQSVNLPASVATGIPVTLSDGTGVQSVDFDLGYDPALLTITNVTVASGITGNVSFSTATTGLLRVSYFGSDSLPTNSPTFLNISASVPDNAPYSAKQVLDLRNIDINEGTIASVDDDAVHVAAYLGDATGNRGYSGLDASLISRVVVGLDSGHAAYPMLDPIILSDVTANGGLSGLDASLVAQKVVGLTVTQIPALPALTAPAQGGPDPKVYLPQNLTGQIGQTITVPVMLDVTDSGGISLQAGDYALSFDPTKFSVANARLGTLDASGFGISANVNNALGTITVSTFATGSPVNLSFGTSGSVVLLDFTVLAGAALGSSPIDLENDIGGTFTSLNEGGLTLIPAPTNNSNDPVDGLFTIQGNTPDVALSVSAASLSENGGAELVIATLTQTTSQTVTVNLAFTGLATNNVDYSLSAPAITIPAGQLSAAITVTGVNDATFEGDESLVIDIASVTNATENGVQQQALTIADDDTAPVVALTVAPTPFSENGGTTTVTAVLSNPSTQAVTVNLAFSGGATNNVDYSASATSITIPAGSTAGSITLTGLNDLTYEGDELLAVDISSVTGGSENGTQRVTATIADDESAPLVHLAVAPSSFSENGGTTTVTATLTNPSAQAVTINLAFSGGATSGVDYSASAPTITIPAGSTAGSITLTGLNDLTYEGDELLAVDISSVTGGTENGAQQVTVTLTDDDSPPSVQFALASSSASEAAGNVTVVVTLSAPSGLPASVPFTLGGTATGADRTVSASPLMIAAGQTSAAIVVSVVNDPLDELNESVVLQLGAPTGATLGASTTHTLTIIDNDAPPVVQFATLAQNVNESTPTATAIVRLTQPSGLDVTVPITVSGSATNADASVSSTLPVTIPAGQTSAAITIAISDDTAAEPTETLVLTIGTPTNATRGAVSAHTLSILDNDSTVAVQLVGGNFNLSEAVGTVPLSVTLSTFALQPVTVPLILSGSADGQDYRLSTTSVTIPAGQTRAIFTLTVTDDQRDELPETLTIQLGTPIGGELGANTAVTVTIDDNDPVLSFARNTASTSDESGTITVIARSLSPVIADLTVPFISYGSATLGVDYTLSANAFQFLAGASTAAVTLTIVDDAVVELSEAVTFSLQPPTNTSLGSPGLYTLFISDNDTPLAVGLDLNGLASGQDFLSPVGEFVEDAGALVIVPNATVVPPGVQTLSSLVVYLESAPNGAAESLTAVNSGGATATAYNQSTRSLTISGGSTSDQQAVLRSVAYQNSSQNPTAGGRFITVTANFSASTESRRRKLLVTPIDDAPVVTTTAGTPTYVTGGSPLIVDADVALTDIENNRLVRAEVTITDGESGDLLSLSSPVAGFMSTFASNKLTITANAGSGNLAAFRSALSRVQFSTTTLGDGNRSVSFVVTDTSGLAGVAGATSVAAVRPLTVQSPLLVAASPLNSAAAQESLTPSQLAPLVHEALARWESAGASDSQLNVLRAATIEIRDLADPRTLALAGGSTITLDINAAGRGWFLDSTPSADEEFNILISSSDARASSGPAVDRVDLLTTVMHEFGHLLGFDDHSDSGLFADTLPIVVRRTLTANEISQYFTQLGS